MVAALSPAALVCFVLLWGADPPERTWTSSDGRQIQARLLRQSTDSVTLLRNGQEFILPLTRLSAADQQYLRELASGKAAHPPAAENPFATPEEKAAAVLAENPFATPEEKAAGAKPENPFVTPEERAAGASPQATPLPATPPAGEEKPPGPLAPALPLGKTRKPPAQDRVWTDRFGKTVTARFVRMNGAVVLLMRGNKPQPIPFNLLSEADQQHLRQFLEERGLGQQAPPPAADPGAGLAGIPAVPAAVPPPSDLPPGAPPPPTIAPPTLPPLPASAAEAFARLQEESQRRADEARQRAEAIRADQERMLAEQQAQRDADAAARESQRQADEQARAARTAEQRANATASLPAPSPPPVVPGPPNPPSPPPPPTPPPSSEEEVRVFTCSKCNKQVGEADKSCPHCGTFFLYTQDADTGRLLPSRSSGNSSSKASAVFGAILCLGFGAAVLIGLPVACIVLLVKLCSPKPSPPPQAPFGQRSYYG